MGRRGARIVILCEDVAHEQFSRRVLLKRGYHRREMRFVRASRAKGAADQRVCEAYKNEVKLNRSERTHQSVQLLVVIDADTHTVRQRKAELDNALQQCHMEVRAREEPISIWVPKRCIETWVAWLCGKKVDEQTKSQVCKNLVEDCDYEASAKEFVEYYSDRNKKPAALPSILDACEELARLD